MGQHELDWTQHEVSFGVWHQEKCMGLLRVIPLGCQLSEQRDDPDAPRYAAYGIYVQVRVERLGLECVGGDFVHPNCFRELLALLKNETPAAPARALITGDDGGIEIHFQRQEDGFVAVTGQIPAKGGDWWFSSDPLRLRQAMKTTVQFEFVLAPQQALETVGELENLLSHLRSAEEQESR